MVGIIRRYSFLGLTSLQERRNRLFNQILGLGDVRFEPPMISADVVAPKLTWSTP